MLLGFKKKESQSQWAKLKVSLGLIKTYLKFPSTKRILIYKTEKINLSWHANKDILSSRLRAY